MSPMRDWRSLLFVPAHRQDRFEKAAASGADAVCIDLEDAVPAADRAAARAALPAFLNAQRADHRYGVRISSLTTADGLRDVLLLADARPAFVMLAKTESAAEVALLARHLPGCPLIALVETARGLQAAAAIAAAHASLQALMFGGADFAADIGCAFAWEPLLHARSTIVAAAAGAGLAAIDVPWLDIADGDGARAEAARVAALGYTAKSLIHPAQVAPVHAGMAPGADALRQAQHIVDAAGSRGGLHGGALRVDGQMIDRPLLLAAQSLLRRAAQ